MILELIKVNKNKSDNELLEALDDIISRCVRSRMISDVPIGAFSSGGIDSSLVIVRMSKYSSTRLKLLQFFYTVFQYYT